MHVEPLASAEPIADLATRLTDLPGLCWLDGDSAHIEGGYSYLGVEPIERVETSFNTSEPLAILASVQNGASDRASSEHPSAPSPANVPRFVGYIAYDAWFAGRSHRLPRPAHRKVLSFSRYDALVAHNHCDGTRFIVGDDEQACKKLLSRLSRRPRTLAARMGAIVVPPRAQHAEAIEAALRHIALGDIYQVNLARMWQAPFAGEPLALWLRMREQGGVPLGFYYDDGTRTVLARTMERFLRWERSERRLCSRPIKGTIAREGDRDGHDAAMLCGDAKERAEHAMIVDLMRNDLGRVAEVGTVEVPEVMAVEPYAQLLHLTSTVCCRTRSDVSVRAVLDATFPPGSVTGTPKLRAIEVIEALEAVPRDIYTGAVGYIDREGGLSLAVAIRTAIAEPGNVRYYAGGGIVEASQVERELCETELKARGFLEAASRLSLPIVGQAG